MGINRFDTFHKVQPIQTYNPSFYPIDYVPMGYDSIVNYAKEQQKKGDDSKAASVNLMNSLKHIEVLPQDQPDADKFHKEYYDKLSGLADEIIKKGYSSPEVHGKISSLSDEIQHSLISGDLGIMRNNFLEKKKQDAMRAESEAKGDYQPENWMSPFDKYEGYKKHGKLAAKQGEKYVDASKWLDERGKGWMEDKYGSVVPDGQGYFRSSKLGRVKAEDVTNGLREMLVGTQEERQLKRTAEYHGAKTPEDVEKFIRGKLHAFGNKYGFTHSEQGMSEDSTANQLRKEGNERKEKEAVTMIGKSSGFMIESNMPKSSAEHQAFLKGISEQRKLIEKDVTLDKSTKESKLKELDKQENDAKTAMGNVLKKAAEIYQLENLGKKPVSFDLDSEEFNKKKSQVIYNMALLKTHAPNGIGGQNAQEVFQNIKTKKPSEKALKDAEKEIDDMISSGGSSWLNPFKAYDKMAIPGYSELNSMIKDNHQYIQKAYNELTAPTIKHGNLGVNYPMEGLGHGTALYKSIEDRLQDASFLAGISGTTEKGTNVLIGDVLKDFSSEEGKPVKYSSTFAALLNDNNKPLLDSKGRHQTVITITSPDLQKSQSFIVPNTQLNLPDWKTFNTPQERLQYTLQELSAPELVNSRRDLGFGFYAENKGLDANGHGIVEVKSPDGYVVTDTQNYNIIPALEKFQKEYKTFMKNPKLGESEKLKLTRQKDSYVKHYGIPTSYFD